MSSMIQTPSEVQCSKLEFGPVKVMDNGGKTVNLRYDGRDLKLEAPSLNVPYGVNIFDKNGPPKYSVDLSFRGAEDNEQVRALQTFFEEFDERMIDAGVENAQKWFKMANPSREVLKAFYTPMIKISRDQQGNPKPYPPTFKLALRKRKGAKPDPEGLPASESPASTFETEFYNGAAKPLALFERDTPIDKVLGKRSQATVIMHCTGVWFAGGKFGTTWKAVQIRVDSQPEQIRGPAFRSEAPDIRAFVSRGLSKNATSSAPADADLDEDEGEDEGEEVVAAVLPKRAAPVVVEDDEDEAPVPVPKKAVKKVVAKK